MSITREVSLWLNNEIDSYKVCTAMAKACLQRAVDNESHARSARNGAIEALAEDIKGYLEETMPPVDGMWGSILQSALADIDFEEVAGGFLEDEEIFSVFSTDSEDATLFLAIEEARQHLEDMLDDDNTMHAGLFFKVADLRPGETVSIDGVEYTVSVS